MAKLQLKDLTLELLNEMKESESAQEVKEFLADKGYEVSDRGAELIFEQLQEGEVELNDEQLKAIAGGCGSGGNYGGTQDESRK